MIYYVECTPETFDYWAGAKRIWERVCASDDELFQTAVDLVESFASDCCESASKTDINDYVWFQLADDLKDLGFDLY